MKISWKSRFIEKHSEEIYAKEKDRQTAYKREWRKRNPEGARKLSDAQCRKAGKNYAKTREYKRTGVQGERELIRAKHGKEWRQYKKIIAPGSQLHHS